MTKQVFVRQEIVQREIEMTDRPWKIIQGTPPRTLQIDKLVYELYGPAPYCVWGLATRRSGSCKAVNGRDPRVALTRSSTTLYAKDTTHDKIVTPG